MSRTLRIGLLVLLCMSAAVWSVGQTPPPAPLTYTNIDLPGQQQTIVGGINDSGEMVGAFRDSAGVQHGYATSPNGAFRVIDFPGATATLGEGINNRGDIVGSYADARRRRHGFLLSDGNFTTVDFPAPNAIFNFAADINDRREIAGIYNTSDGAIHGYLLTADGFTSLDFSPGPFPVTQAFGINNRGQVVGDFDDDLGLHGFIFRSGALKQVDVPGEQQTGATGISERDELIGSALDSNFVQHGFLRVKDTFFLVDFPGASATAPSKINDRGTIVGRYQDQARSIHSFLAEPSRPDSDASETQNSPVPRERPTRICGSEEWREHPEDIKDPGSCVIQH